MNDDDLVVALRDAMQTRTSGDVPSRELMRSLTTTRVRGPRPYLAPFSAAAVVTALTTGGVLLAQAGPGLEAGSDPTPAPSSAAPTPTAVAGPTPSAAPSVIGTPTAVAPSTVPAPTTTASPTASGAAAPTTEPAPTTTGAAAPTTEPTPTPTAITSTPTAAAVTATPISAAVTNAPTLPADDSALLASAASYSVTERTVTDPTLPDTTTKTHVQVFKHDDSKPFYAQRTMLTWDELATLPTATESFRAAVKESGQPPNAVEKGLQELPLEGPLPYEQRKAAFAVAGSMPGARVTEDTHDGDGRPATRVEIETGWMLDDYYFDPTSYRLLESSSFVTPEWQAHWRPLNEQTGQTIWPLGTGYEVLYSGWTITPQG